jgi:hypothetical protein
MILHLHILVSHSTINVLLTSVMVSLLVTYPDDYPDVLPELDIEEIEGELSEEEKQELLDGLQALVSNC